MSKHKDNCTFCNKTFICGKKNYFTGFFDRVADCCPKCTVQVRKQTGR